MEPKIDAAFNNNFLAELTQLREKEGVNYSSKSSFQYVIMFAQQNEYPDELKNKIIEVIKENQKSNPNNTINNIKAVVDEYHVFKRQNEIELIKKEATDIINMKSGYYKFVNKLKVKNQLIDNNKRLFDSAALIMQTPNEKLDLLRSLLYQLRTYEALNENIYDIKILIEEGCNQLQELLHKGDHQQNVSEYENAITDVKLKAATLKGPELFLAADNLDNLKKKIESLDWVKKILEKQEEIKKHIDEELKKITVLEKMMSLGGNEIIEKLVPEEIVNEEFVNKIHNYKKMLEKISELDSDEKIVDYYESEVKTIEKDFKKDFHQNFDKLNSEFQEIIKKDIEQLISIQKNIQLDTNFNISEWVGDSLSILNEFSKIKEISEFSDSLAKYEKFLKEKQYVSVKFYELYEEHLNKLYFETFYLERKFDLFNKLITNSNASSELLKWKDDFNKILKNFQSFKEIYERKDDSKKELEKPDGVYDLILDFSKSQLPPNLKSEFENIINEATELFKKVADNAQKIMKIEKENTYNSGLVNLTKSIKQAETEKLINEVTNLIDKVQLTYDKIILKNIPDDKRSFHQKNLLKQFLTSFTASEFRNYLEYFNKEVKDQTFNIHRRDYYFSKFTGIHKMMFIDFLNQKERPENITIPTLKTVKSIAQIFEHHPLLEKNLDVMLDDFFDFKYWKNYAISNLSYVSESRNPKKFRDLLIQFDETYSSLIKKTYFADNPKEFIDNLYALTFLYSKRRKEFQEIFNNFSGPNNSERYLIREPPIIMYSKISTEDPLEKCPSEILAKFQKRLEAYNL